MQPPRASGGVEPLTGRAPAPPDARAVGAAAFGVGGSGGARPPPGVGTRASKRAGDRRHQRTRGSCVARPPRAMTASAGERTLMM